jgi:hypothetical protein
MASTITASGILKIFSLVVSREGRRESYGNTPDLAFVDQAMQDRMGCVDLISW